MADRYIYHGGNGSAPTSFVSGMAGAYATEDAAIAAASAGDRFFYAHDHAETVTLSGAKTVTFPGTAASPNQITCIDRTSGADASGNAAGSRAAVTYSGDNTVTINGHFVHEGVDRILTGAVSARNIAICGASSNSQRWRRSRITTAAVLNSRLAVGGVGTLTQLGPDFEVQCSNANANVTMAGRVEWTDSTPFVGATIPTNAFYASNTGTEGIIRGCDMTAFGSKTLMAASTTALRLALVNCELPTTYTASATQTVPGFLFEIINCSKPDGTLVNERHTSYGSRALDATVYRTGTAPYVGDSYSMKLISSTGANRSLPLASFDVRFMIEAGDVGVAKTLTAYLATDNVTLAANEAWVEVDYLGDADALDTTRVSSGPANVSANGTAPAADAVSSWTGVPGTPVKQTVSAGFTPQRDGLHRVRVMLAKASTTAYVDPQVVLT